jgi:hypothetical protein
MSDSCAAWLTDTSPASPNCANPSYAGGLVIHEYGHLIHWQLGLGFDGIPHPEQGSAPFRSSAFAEGFADTVQILINDDPIIGRDFYSDPLSCSGDGATECEDDLDCAEAGGTCVGHARDILTANVQFDNDWRRTASLAPRTTVATVPERQAAVPV